MKSALVKLILVFSVCAMVALAVVGTWYVADQSSNISIVVPPKHRVKTLPTDAPTHPKRTRAIIPVPDVDIPSPR